MRVTSIAAQRASNDLGKNGAASTAAAAARGDERTTRPREHGLKRLSCGAVRVRNAPPRQSL